ncbi:MAG: MFS transporter [Mariprofundaceae bacterium]
MRKLLWITSFIPFILVMFLNAFVDLGHKIIIQNTVFKVYDGQMQVVLTAIVNGLILLPFVMLFTPAGYLSDRFRKPNIMCYAAFSAVVLTLMITVFYYLGWFQAAFAMTFLLAVQSAIYSPAKYGYIKELVGKEMLASANAIVQSVTIVAILMGVFIFSIFFEAMLAGHEWENEADIMRLIAPVGGVLVICSLLELFLAFKVRKQQVSASPQEKTAFDWHKYLRGQSLITNARLIRRHQVIWLSIVGLALFWGIAQVLLASFPAFAKETLGEMNTVVIQGVIACTALGIMVGSIWAGVVSSRYIETGLIPLGAAGIVVCLFFIPLLGSTTLLAINFFAVGVFGGLFIVPLNALIQYYAREHQLGTILAGNNWAQNVVMLLFLLLTVVFSLQGFSAVYLLQMLMFVALLGAVYTVWKLPQSLVRLILSVVMRGFYKVKVVGFEHIPSEGGVLLLGNHISWLDWAMIQIASPRPVRFVMDRHYYSIWYLKWAFDLFKAIPITSSGSRSALKEVNGYLQRGEVVCLFPEGAISHSGQLGEFKAGFELAAAGARGVIVPFYLQGMWGSRFSRSRQRLKGSRKAQEIILAFGTPLPMDSQHDVVKQAVSELSVKAWDSFSDSLYSIPKAWCYAMKRLGRATFSYDQQGDSHLSGHQAWVKTIFLSRQIQRQVPAPHVGLLLPGSRMASLMNMAALISGKIVVNLDDEGLTGMKETGVPVVYTSKKFVGTLKRRGFDVDMFSESCRLLYIEDEIIPAGRMTYMLLWLMAVFLPAPLLTFLFCQRLGVNDVAAITFSNGMSTRLTHRQISTNMRQVLDVLDIGASDRMLSTLPLSGGEGLVACLLPFVEGVPVITVSDPRRALAVGRAMSSYQGTIFLASPELLQKMIQHDKVSPLMLKPLRIVVCPEACGSERIADETRHDFQLKFNQDIYDSYGIAEVAPFISMNIPDRLNPNDWHLQIGRRSGSVGMALPGNSVRVANPVSIQQPLKTNETGLILAAVPGRPIGDRADGDVTDNDTTHWLKTGRKGCLDADGFLTVKAVSE